MSTLPLAIGYFSPRQSRGLSLVAKTRRLFFKGTAVSACQRAPGFTRCAQVEAASSRGCLQKKKAPSSQMVLFWSGRRGSNSLPGIPRMAMAIRGSPASPRMISRAARRSRQRVLGAVCKKESTIFSDGAFLERATRLELATSTLARSRSTR